MARPEKVIDWDKVDLLLRADCKGTEIAPHFDICANTLYARIKDKYNLSFQEYSCLKKQQGDSQIKAKQLEKALDGDNTILIWLGKCRLKQRDYDTLTESVSPEDKTVLQNKIMELNGIIESLRQQLGLQNESKTEPELS